MGKDSVMVLNDYGLTSRTRIGTGKAGNPTRGKTRYSVTIKSEPILVETDPKALGAAPALAIRDHYKRSMRNISEPSTQATLRARQTALKAVVAGEPWAMKQYSGGRTGTKPPARSDRFGFDSGRFIDSIAVGTTRDGYVINVAANRLDPSTMNGGEAGLQRFVEKLRGYVPGFGNAAELVNVLSVQRAIRDSTKAMLQKATDRTVELKRQIMGQVFSGIMRLVG